jgi:hypothetical protein
MVHGLRHTFATELANADVSVYTYDPAGNITHIRDDAQQRIFFDNHRIEPSNDYTYDALYRLIHWKDPTARGSIGSVFPPGLAQLKATPSILLVTGALFVLVKSLFDHGVELGEFGVD